MRIICLSQKCTRSQTASLLTVLTIREQAESKFIGQAACGESACPSPRAAAPAPPRPTLPAANRSFQQLTDAVRPVSRRRRASEHVFPAPCRPPRTSIHSRATLADSHGAFTCEIWNKSVAVLSRRCVIRVQLVLSVEPVHLVCEAGVPTVSVRLSAF